MSDTEAAIRSALEAFWDERAIPSGPSGETTVEELLAPVESMTAVDVLVELDKISGLKLPNTLIRKGGYDTRDQFVADLTNKVMQRISDSASPHSAVEESL